MREENIFLLIMWSSHTTLVSIKCLEEDTLGKSALNSTLQINILRYFITSYSSYTATAHSFMRIIKSRVRVFTYANL